MSEYLPAILARVGEVLSRQDREFFSKSYGSGDRVHWCWKFTDFPGARFQESLHLLAWLYSAEDHDNPWKGNWRLLEGVHAGLGFWKKIQYRDGSFDEAYPYEHSLAATAFTLFYVSEAVRRVQGELSPEARRLFDETAKRAGVWLCSNDEHHGFLSNHLAAAAAALVSAGLLLNEERFLQRADYFLGRILERQSSEGWYEEYGGADPGYQTHASFYLARIQELRPQDRLAESLSKANAWLLHFVHPDGSLGGEYASRNTGFYYPAAFEILQDTCPAAAAVATHMRPLVAEGRTVGLPQMDAYNLLPVLNNYIFAHEARVRGVDAPAKADLPCRIEGCWTFPQAGLLVKSAPGYFAILGGRKGGVLRIWDKATGQLAAQSAGYLAWIAGRPYSNQAQGLSVMREEDGMVTVEAPFVRVNQKLFHPWLFVAFRLFNLILGPVPAMARWVKGLLVQVLVARKTSATLALQRMVRFEEDHVVVEDKLSDAGTEVEHMDKFSTIHMGSSRYVHLEEELLRGRPVRGDWSFDSKGVLAKGKVQFP